MLDNPKKRSGSKPPVLKAFGDEVAEARKRQGMSQKDLAETFGKFQSYVARLEDGLVEPSLEVLNALSSALHISLEKLAALVLQGKYDLDAAVVAPLTWRPKTIGRRSDDSDLAIWEMSQEHTELWIVTPKFIDLDFSNVRDEVRKFLDRGGKIIFFTGQDQEDDFKKYKQKIDYSDHNFSAVFLNKARLGLLVASCVIANPMAYDRQNEEPNFPKGYLILSDETDQPIVALEMSRTAVRERAKQLDMLRDELTETT